MTKEQFLEKINKKFADENFSIIYMGKNSSENSIIKCLDCNRKITVNTGELFRSRRKHICSKCYYLRKDTQINRDKVLTLLKDKAYNIEFFMKKQSKNGNKSDCVRFTCLKCDYINELWVCGILRSNQCNCQRCSGQRKDKDDIIKPVPKSFSYIMDPEYIKHHYVVPYLNQVVVMVKAVDKI